MSGSVFFFLVCVLVLVGTLQLLGRRSPRSTATDAALPGAAGRKGAWQSTIGIPALLVPAALSGAVAWAIAVWAALPHGTILIESPLPIRGWSWENGRQMLLASSAFLISAILLAGNIGLLRAHARGQRPGGEDFVAGIADHTLTVLLAKLLVGVWITGMSHVLAPSYGFLAISYQAPSLLLAPILGTAAFHPRRPIAALVQAWEFGNRHLGRVALLVGAQGIVLVTHWLVLERLRHGAGPGIHDLARSASPLSFNSLPFVQGGLGYHSAGGLACAASATLFSAAFIHLYFRQVMRYRDA